MSIGVLAYNAGGSVLAHFAQHAATEYYRYISRMISMKRAIREGTSSEKTTKLRRLLVRAFGSEGELNETFSATLHDLSESGFLGHLAFVAVADIRPTISKELFNVLYSRRGGTAAEANRFFAKLMKALATALRVQTEIDGFGLREFKNEAVRRESAIAKNLLPVTPGVGTGQRTIAELKGADPHVFAVEEDVGRVRTALAQEHIVRCDSIDVHDPRGATTPVPLDDIFVPLSLVARSSKDTSGIEVRNVLFSSESSLLSSEQVFGFSQRVLVQGDPGSGKTTLVQKYCLDLAKAALSNHGYPVPILIRLRYYDAYRAKGGGSSLIDFLVSSTIEALPDIAKDDLRSALHHLLVFGRCVLVFDGMDEVLSIDRRLEVRNEITHFLRRYPYCRVVVTSRIVGYDRAPLRKFPIFEVAPLGQSQIKSLYETISVYVLGRTQQEAASAYPAFSDEAFRAAEEFMHNPLLLSLIVILYTHYREIPDERARLYEACARLMYDRWDGFRSINPELPDKHSLFPLLAQLAATLFEQPSFGGRFSSVELSRSVEDFFAEEYPEQGRGRARELASAFVDHLTGRAWVLREIGQDRFEFTHRTFLEYFYARHLDEKFETVDNLIQAIVPHASDWNVPGHLALQVKTREKRESAGKAANALSAIVAASSKEEGGGATRFAAQATEYLQPTHTEMLGLVRNIASKVSGEGASETLSSLLRSESALRQPVLVGLGEGLAMRLHKSGLYSIGPFIDELVAYRADAYLGRLERLSRNDVDIILAAGLDKALSATEAERPYSAKLRFDLTGEIDQDAVEKFGLRLWFSSIRPGGRTDLRGHDFPLMAYETVQTLAKETSANARNYAKLADMVAPVAVEQAGTLSFGPKASSGEAKELLNRVGIPASLARGPSNLVRAAAVSLIGCLEAVEDRPTIDVSPFISSAIANLTGTDDSTAQFLRRWAAGRISLFRWMPQEAKPF